MRKLLLPLFLWSLWAGSGLQAQDTLFFEDLEGASPAISLNTADVSSTTSGVNQWVINNSYTGGSGQILCFGFPFAFTVPNTPAQPTGISSSNGNYLHIRSNAAQTSGINNACFLAADGVCTNPENNFARTAVVNTSGYQNVNLSFWWICVGGPTYFGEVYYSTNSGTSWTKLTSPTSNYGSQASWTTSSITNAAFDNQSNLMFGFRFVNSNGTTGSDPPFSLDDIVVTGTALASVDIDTLTGSTVCAGDTLSIPFTAQGNFQAGNTFSVQLSDAAGSFASPTTIGSVAGTSSGTIQAIIPPGTPAGSGYLLRMTSSNPALTGSPYSTALTVLTPALAGTLSASQDTICPGNTLNLTETGTTGSFQWLTSTDGTNYTGSGVSSSAWTVSPSQTTWYGLSTSNQCGADVASPIMITVLSAPVAGTLTASADTVCAGSSVSIMQSGTSDHFQWFTSTDGINFNPTGDSANVYNHNPGQTTWYSLTTSNQCGSVDATPVMVSTVSQPTAGNITGSADTICVGDSVNMQVSGVSGGDAYWGISTDGISFNYPGATGPAYGSGPLNQTTWFVVEVRSAYCQYVYSDTFRVEVVPQPLASFSFTSNQLTVTFTDLSTGANTWNWDFGDGNTSTQQNPTHTYAAAGTYTVTLAVNSGPCTDSFGDTITVDLTGIGEQIAGVTWQVYPNPSLGQASLHLRNANQQDCRWELHSVEGKKLAEGEIRLRGEATIELPVGGLAKGLYLIRLEIDGKTDFRKLIIE